MVNTAAGGLLLANQGIAVLRLPGDKAAATGTAPGPLRRLWRRVAGTLMVGAVYGPTIFLPPSWYEIGRHWFGASHFEYGHFLAALPGTVLVALLAPLVAYRRRDALIVLFLPGGVRLAWIIGTRLGQLPHRGWPERTGGIEFQGRQAARIAAAANWYRLWRQRHTRTGAAALQSAPPDLPDRVSSL
jgi:hypothetical protein